MIGAGYFKLLPFHVFIDPSVSRYTLMKLRAESCISVLIHNFWMDLVVGGGGGGAKLSQMLVRNEGGGGKAISNAG